METVKTDDPFTIAIDKLRITAEDDWLMMWIKDFGDKVVDSPQYLMLEGKDLAMLDWMRYRNIPYAQKRKEIYDVLESLKKEGQKEPIKIYRSNKINTGHKRAACLLHMGETEVKAIYVPDNYKL